MKGVNVLLLNGATMQEAVQLWLNANFKIPPKVLHVLQNRKDGNVVEFEVRVQEQEAKADV